MLSKFGEEKKALGFFLCCFSSFSYCLRECPLNKTSLLPKQIEERKLILLVSFN